MAINTINGGYTPPVRGGYPERAGPSNVASLPDKPWPRCRTSRLKKSIRSS